MKNYFLSILSLLTVVGTSSISLAQTTTTDTGTSTTQQPIYYFTDQAQRGWAGYIGANLGYTNYNQNLDVEGSPSSIKLLGSYVIPNGSGVFDAGYGVQNQTFSQSSARQSSISGGILELAARYQFLSRWQFGAVANQLFDKGESYGANQGDAQFVGAQLLKEFGFGGNVLGRAGLRVMTSLNIDNQSVNMALVDFQLGWGGPTRSNLNASN